MSVNKHISILIATLLMCGNMTAISPLPYLPERGETPLSCHPEQSGAESKELPDTLSQKKKGGFFRTIGKGFTAVTDFFMGCDTSYITPQLYEFTAKAEASYWHDFYKITSSTTGNSMTIESGNPLIVGGYIYWSIFGYGFSTCIEDIGRRRGDSKGTGRRNSFTVNTARLSAEIYTFKSGKDAKITNITDIELDNKTNNTFAGLSSKCYGINAEYIFNHKRYSWPAAFGENAVQRKSAGSWKLGFSYSHQRIDMDRNVLPDHLKPVIDTTLLFRNVDYKDYAVSIGYGYNWAFRKNCLFAFSIQPSIGYRHSNITRENERRSIFNKLSTDLVTRVSLYWNNTKYFTGLTAEFHTYSYRENNFGLTNTYGTLKFIVGFNFLKKSEYR